MGKLLATILAMLLGFIGTMVLSHIPITVMANKDQQIERSINMTAFESNNKNAVEVDDIRFETIVPEGSYRLPKYGDGEETPIQFGVRITNQTSTPYRFELPLFVPEILNPHGNPLHMNFARNATWAVNELDIPLIMPGESFKYLMDAKFIWYSKNCIELTGYILYGGVFNFYNFKPGKYQIHFKYKNTLAKKNPFMEVRGDTEIDSFWTGIVVTPFTRLLLR
ncbi:MAG: hypothetical protein EAZ76_05685 [Nostocales cyanobacterium]|nr:MAG: hypothetical protein EAZ87_08360 [Nostocales cyanobacterium]TAF17821.1 MAG: hypothetical protein EAZ76_05685 [Nostocales cyanobacterium]